MNQLVCWGGLSVKKALWGLLIAAVCYTGCLTPSVRYSRNAGGSSGKASRTVPATWDYRKTYSLPVGRVEKVARGYLGVPYRFGGMSRRGTDCSGLVCMVYRDVSRAALPHSTRKLRTMGRRVGRTNARSGDLVFFRRGAFGMVGHVGLYLRDGIFIHASTKHGVICSNLSDGYYKSRFVEVRRIFK